MVGVPVIGASGLLIYIDVTVINEYFSKLLERYLRLRNFDTKIRVDYEKVPKKSLMDKFIYEKVGLELKKIYDYYLINKKKIMNATKVGVEDIFVKMAEDVFSNEQLQKLANFLTKVK